MTNHPLSSIKYGLFWLGRLVLVAAAMAVAYILSTTLIQQPALHMTPEEARWAGIAIFIVSAINALVLAYPILRSSWHGLKLIGAVFLIQFGVETFLTQIESLYFNAALQISGLDMAAIVGSGALRALIFAPLAVLALGKMKERVQPGDQRRSRMPPQWIGRLAFLAVLYVMVYLLAGYFVAWQWPETRQFYSGTTAIQPFLAHISGWFRSEPVILPFQLLRGALWALLALLITRVMRAKRWEAALAAALIFAGLLWSGVALFPNPYMPPVVRQSHAYELMFSMLVFGSIAGWVMQGAAGMPKTTSKDVMAPSAQVRSH